MWQSLVGQQVHKGHPGISFTAKEDGREKIPREETIWPLSESDVAGKEGGRGGRKGGGKEGGGREVEREGGIGSRREGVMVMVRGGGGGRG